MSTNNSPARDSRAAEPLDMKAVDARVAETQFSGTIHHLHSVGSTNVVALEAAQSGVRRGVWVADEQTAGRGRGGHDWHSAAGEGLYVSVLVTTPLPMSIALWLSLATGLAAKAAIADASGLNADIRWPNDLMLRGRKCGGILVETAVASADDTLPPVLRHAVIGVGINVNHQHFPPDLERLATSLRIESGKLQSRETLLSSLLRALDREIRLMTMHEPGLEREENARMGLLQRFARASTWAHGKRVRVDEAGGYTGITAGLDSRGFLQVESDDGIRRTVLSGGVREV